jgi:predicted nucleic acid-binding protein
MTARREMSCPCLLRGARACSRAPSSRSRALRTLDALHLATLHYLVEAGQRVALATFDARMAEAARRMSLPLALAP